MWDKSKKQWVDKNAENDNVVGAIGPPPKACELRPSVGNMSDHSSVQSQPSIPQSAMSNSIPGFQCNNLSFPNAPPNNNNIYKLQKSRGNTRK